VQHARERVIEAACETSDELLHKYLEGKELTSAEIRAALRKGTVALHFTPVLCGASFKNKGVQQLLDAIVDYLPSRSTCRRSTAPSPTARPKSCGAPPIPSHSRARLQDHDRSVRRPARLHPRLFRATPVR